MGILDRHDEQRFKHNAHAEVGSQYVCDVKKENSAPATS